MKKICIICTLLAVVLLFELPAAEKKASTAMLLPEDIHQKFSASLPEVIFHLKYTAVGNSANALGLYCAACNTFHDNDLSLIQADNRPLAVTGFMVGPKLVIAPDLMIDSDGIGAITVLLKGKMVLAKIKAFFPDQGALLLELQKELPGAQELKFSDAKADKKLFAYSRIMEYGRWAQRVTAFAPQRMLSHYSGSRPASPMPGNSLILNSKSEPVGLLTNNNELPQEIAWDLPWQKWRQISARDFVRMRLSLAKRLAAGLAPATVYFRRQNLSRRERIAGVNPPSEFLAYVFKMPDGKVVMPILATPRQHTLIEKIVVHLPKGGVTTYPERVMKNYGLLELHWQSDWPLNPIALKTAPMTRFAGDMIWRADINIYANKLDVKLNTDALGLVVRAYNNVPSGDNIKRGVPEMIFTLQGDLLGVNVSVRAFNYNRKIPFTDASALAGMLANKRFTVPFKELCNPLNAVGYLGVEYQVLNRDLARSMEISHLTAYGSEGLLISHIDKGSPAEKLGLKAGDVLLKILVPGTGAPIALQGKKFGMPQERQFPWQNLDRIPEQYFSEIPEPWKGVKNPLNEQLSNIGIGRKAVLIAIVQGKVKRIPFTVENVPVYYEIAPRFNAAAMGIEVRDITFELRRYFRMKPNADGVIISDVKAGSQASTAGLRPFEIVTAVNDTPVKNVEAFRKAVEGKSEVRLAVRRLAAGRVVTVKNAVEPRQ